MNSARILRLVCLLSNVSFVLVGLSLSAQDSQAPFGQPFQQGCCVNRSFPRPAGVSQSSISRRRLLEALHCASGSRFVGGSGDLAKALGNKRQLTLAYYYGKYMPEQEGRALTIAVYSANGKHGALFDMAWDSRQYFVANLPELLKASNQWRVGEINGGLWSYTRLWYLAQEIGSRRRQWVSIREIEQATPASCMVFTEDETAWTPAVGRSAVDPRDPQHARSLH
jgi:hypothetical protein